MSFRKYQAVEKVEVVPEDESERIRTGITRLGKTSATELTDSEKRDVLDSEQNLH